MNCQCKDITCKVHQGGACCHRAGRAFDGLCPRCYVAARGPKLAIESVASRPRILESYYSDKFKATMNKVHSNPTDDSTLEITEMVQAGLGLVLTATANDVAESGGGRFIGVRKAVMCGNECVAVAKSKTFAKRIARALNLHKPNREGV